LRLLQTLQAARQNWREPQMNGLFSWRKRGV
jgi:hypothetical protein